MLNHVRTLLLNQDGAINPGVAFLGEEAVPAEFHAVALPSHLQAVRARLFGTDPDRAMRNYRLAQFMPLLHATELAEHVLAFDARVTYLDSDRSDLFDAAAFTPLIAAMPGTTAVPALQGRATDPDATGRLWHDYTVRMTAADQVSVIQHAPAYTNSILSLSFTDGLSGRVALADSGYGLLLPQVGAGSTWKVQFFKRPAWALGQLLTAMETIGEPTLLALFGVTAAEPYATFRSLWQQHPELAYRLGGLLLALAHRTEEARLGNG